MSAKQGAKKAWDRLWSRVQADYRVLFALLLLVGLLRMPLHASLWLDEGITAWVTGGSLLEAVQRATEFQGQSPLYFILEWITQILLGRSEIVLRALSVVGFLGAAWLVVVLARRWGGITYGWLAGAIFVTIDSVQVAGASARPYGLALFFALAAVWALMRWEERGRYRDSLVYLGAFLLSVYLQYLFAFMLVLHALHVVLNFRTQKVRLISYAMQLFLIAALLFPAFLHLVNLQGRGAQIGFLPRPQIVGLVQALVPPVLIVAAASGLLFAAFFGNHREVAVPKNWKLIFWIGAWCIIPPLFFFIASRESSVSLFYDRYFLFYTPALAFALAAVPRLWSNESAQRLAVLGIGLVLLEHQMDRNWVVEDWRGAAATLNVKEDSWPVFVYSGLAESKDVGWLQDPEKRDYLTAPLWHYKLTDPRVPLPPPVATDEFEAYIQKSPAGRLIDQSDHLFFVGLEQKIGTGSTVDGWVNHFKKRHFEPHELPLAPQSLVHVFELTRVTTPAPDDQTSPTSPPSQPVPAGTAAENPPRT